MATFAVSCPECEKQFKASDESVGKKVRCKGCGHTFVVKAPKAVKPAAKGKADDDDDDDTVQVQAEAPTKKPVPKKKPEPPKPEPKPAPKADDDDDENDKNPYGMTQEYMGVRCPFCASEMGEEDIICLSCGYNTQTRVSTTTKKTIEHTGMEVFLWWLPGIACVLTIIGLIVFDILFSLYIEEWSRDQWYSFLAAGGVKMWIVIPTLFMMWAAGRFAVKRLIFNYRPPEKLKKDKKE